MLTESTSEQIIGVPPGYLGLVYGVRVRLRVGVRVRMMERVT